MLAVLGLCFGSFVEALVWRIHQQSLPKKQRAASDKELSMTKGRSMCPHCKHQLSIIDLIPLLSWISLRGRCRYCKNPIGWHAPLLEVVMAGLFIASYIFWPFELTGRGVFEFIVWLPALVALVALAVYDLRWWLLPNKIVFPLLALAASKVLLVALFYGGGFSSIIDAVMSLSIAGGLFYILFKISSGKWIGGGDVKLGFAIGLILGSPALALLMIFLASLLGTVVALPGLLMKRLARSSKLPFGPFLITSTILVVLFGSILFDWYEAIIDSYVSSLGL